MTKSLINIETNLSQSAALLIEKISDAIGVLYEPKHIQNTAKARADAKLYELIVNNQIDSCTEKSLNRMLYLESRQVSNINQIITKAVPHLAGNSPVKDMEEDWISLFFEYCKHVSNEEMQTLWASILAGEANTPGTFSSRTLNCVKLLSKDEALLFSKYCQFVFYAEMGTEKTGVGIGTHLHILGEKTNIYLREKAGLSTQNVATLEAAGFVLSTIRMRTKFYDGEKIYCRNKPYKIRLGEVQEVRDRGRTIEEVETTNEDNDDACIVIEFIGLTVAGAELYPFACTNTDEGYFNLVKSELQERGCFLDELQ